ncbi:MAG TPA: ATP-binding protein [Caulobacteraceae bacterium]|nr:ATP-binding protein [Caulobacteraceae bacterium]
MDEYTQVRAARVRSVYERLTGASLITVVNGGLMAAVLEWRIPTPWPWLWLSLVVALASVRIVSERAYARDPDPSDRLRAWEALATVGSLLSGALWGVGAAWLFPADEAGQWLWIFLIAGMCAGAATLHAAHPPTAIAYIVPAGAPLALRLALVGRPPQLAAAAMIVVFLVATAFTILRFSRQFSRVFNLQLDLEQRTLDLDEANSRLRAEIEHHRSTEATLRQAQKMEALGQITGGIAHDFNNLLTVITGNLDLIRRRAPENEVVQRLAAAATHAAKRGADLTGSLLSFARKQALRPEAIDVNALIQDFTELLRRAVGETVTLELDLAAAPSTSYADAAHFQSAILNLVINARDSMAGGGRVAISTRSLAHDDAAMSAQGAIVVCVSDSGAGMTPTVAARAFEPFFTTKAVGKGSGLGLSQVYGFAHQSGGYASIESREGQGTSVSIVLPVRAAGAAATGDGDGSGRRRARASGPVRVLLVEDDLEVLSTLRQQMILGGWSVVPAQDGQAALALLDADPLISILVSDVMMPGSLSGMELARSAATMRPGLPILLMSGYPGAALAEGGGDETEFDLLRKPFSHQELVERVLAAIAAPEEPARTEPVRG